MISEANSNHEVRSSLVGNHTLYRQGRYGNITKGLLVILSKTRVQDNWRKSIWQFIALMDVGLSIIDDKLLVAVIRISPVK